MTNTISRIAIGVLSALLLIGAMIAGTAYAGSVVKKNNLIDEQTAEEFAFVDAGVKSDSISEISANLDYDHGKYEYNIKFNIENAGYEYEIDAQDGSVLSKEIKINDEEQSKGLAENNDPAGQQTTTDTQLPAEPADRAPDETTNETTPNTMPETAAPKVNTNSYISVDQAKKTALEHAGLSENQVKFSSAKLENEDGQFEYEIEFYKDLVEYEYEIDAVTGEIMKSEIDYD